ncbi:hypothetical protein WH50_01015 [Pokkaliibacter plantistimulans]|uniref:Uncharacterized protein n=1 Tax=Pokkaliibacter plantistimulans TaxID=1635171 RepID=A0ABX5M620_9GAMM|nr:hypothetical protein WH50_01015 [Pokkaliibacter plantistimulans]
MIRVSLLPPASQWRQNSRALVQPFTMYAVSGSIEGAAGNPLMGLHDIKIIFCQYLKCFLIEIPFFTYSSPFWRIAANRVKWTGSVAKPLAGDDRNV